MKKITKSTFKSFIKKNEGKLYIQTKSDFDGMSDCVEFIPSNQRKFMPLQKHTATDFDFVYGKERGRTPEEVEASILSNKNTLGYSGIWLVNSSRDSFKAFDDGQFEGIEVYNCCGSFVIATPKRI